MKPENKKFLDDNLDQFRTLERAQYLRGLMGSIREAYQRIMSEEFVPGFTADIWCGACVTDMVQRLYGVYYYNWLKENYDDGQQHADKTDGIEKMNLVYEKKNN